MKGVLPSVVCALLAVSVSAGDLSPAIDAKLASTDSMLKLKLGLRLTDDDKYLFGEDLAVRAFEHGVVFALRQGEHVMVQIVPLQDTNPHETSGGRIRAFYKEHGGAKVYGEPLEGPINLFDEQYRTHIFQRGIIIVRQKEHQLMEHIVLDKSFKY
jgi:hypothetical protein